MSSEFVLSRDIPATVIPAGDAVTLAAGTSAHVMQTLGGSVTVRTDGGLFRISRESADALTGFDTSKLGAAEAVAAAGEFSEDAVWAAMKTCFDPEIPVNIVDLGLVYDLSVEKTATGGHVLEVKMTLTAPGCGMGEILVDDVRSKLEMIPTVAEADVELVFDPPWGRHMMSEAAKLETGML